ncbi:MAG: hypothetical protein ABJF88_07635 [Rhodothermales bacterium]
MATERKAHIVYFDPSWPGEGESIRALNALMNDGWLPIHTTGMGGAATGAPAGADVQSGYAALVILQREREYAVSGFGS